MSKKEVIFIVVTIVGAFALYALQTYRMAQHHLPAPSPAANAAVASDTAQPKLTP